MSDDLDRQIEAYFGALAGRVEPLDAGAVPPAMDPGPASSSRPKGRAPMLVVAAVFLVAVVCVGAVLIDRRSDSEGFLGSSSSGACDSLKLDVETDPSPADAGPIASEDVLFREWTTNETWGTGSGSAAPNVLVSSDGTVVAFDVYDTSASAPTYRTAKLTPDALEALRGCVTGVEFQSMGEYMEFVPKDDGGFCAIADASTEHLAAGPASGMPKEVSAYAIGAQFAGGSRDCHGAPASLIGLYDASEALREQVIEKGVPTDPPAADLETSAPGEVGSGACSAIPVEVEPGPAGGEVEPVRKDDAVFTRRSANAMSSFDAPMLVVSSSGEVVALDWRERLNPLTYVAARVTPDTLAALQSCLVSQDFQSLGDYLAWNGPNEDGKFCGVADASTDTFLAGPPSGVPKQVSAYALDMAADVEYQDRNICGDIPQALVDLYKATVDLHEKVMDIGTAAPAPED